MKLDLVELKNFAGRVRQGTALPRSARGGLELARLKKLGNRLRLRAALAISLEPDGIAAGLLRQEEWGTQMLRAFSLPTGAAAVLADPETAGREIAAQLAAAQIREKRCAVCIPPSWALTIPIDVPAIAADDLRDYLELRAEREFPTSVAELRLAHSAYAAPDGKRRGTLAGVPAKRLEAVERMLAAAGLRADSISLGLDRCLSRAGSAGAVHFLATGADGVDMAVSAGGGIALLRSLRVPAAGALTAFITEVRISLGRLPETVRQEVRDAYFAGPPALADRIAAELEKPLLRLGIESRPPAPELDADRPAGPASEAAELLLSRRSAAFEFVVPQTNRWQAAFIKFDSRRRRWLVGAAAALLLLPAVAFYLRSSSESRLEAEWQGMRDKVADLESIQQKIRRFRPWFDAGSPTLQTFEGLMAAFPEAGNVWAKSVELGEGGKVTCTGNARNQDALGAMLDQLRKRPDVTGVTVQQIRGENPVQFTVVYKWSPRLEN